ncbi:hypothetical protein EJ08DRAFT_457381 [Tothia fuscella]|uniref:Uncharacterized protein n=1 Tax=Tothia fuscella TaxID=1048955 RepID=A0A9P4NIA6_9PEZI|nr:hypothetical protein EJ08DRAFT_457381 [Tothia fuscella]
MRIHARRAIQSRFHFTIFTMDVLLSVTRAIILVTLPSPLRHPRRVSPQQFRQPLSQCDLTEKFVLLLNQLVAKDCSHRHFLPLVESSAGSKRA